MSVPLSVATSGLTGYVQPCSAHWGGAGVGICRIIVFTKFYTVVVNLANSRRLPLHESGVTLFQYKRLPVRKSMPPP
jgi:hypothetical protein